LYKNTYAFEKKAECETFSPALVRVLEQPGHVDFPLDQTKKNRSRAATYPPALNFFFYHQYAFAGPVFLMYLPFLYLVQDQRGHNCLLSA
jgi:hypothetical protein